MPSPGQPLRFLWWMNDQPVQQPCGFGEIYAEDASFYEDAGATAQIQTMYPDDEILMVKISEDDVTVAYVNNYYANCQDMCGAGANCATINSGTHGYTYICQYPMLYNPPSVPIILYPIDTFTLCPHSE